MCRIRGCFNSVFNNEFLVFFYETVLIIDTFFPFSED